MHDVGLSLGPFQVASIVVVLAAILGYLNHRFVRLPQTIGLTLLGALASLVAVVADAIIPGSFLAHAVRGLLERIDFETTLLEGLLSFLLFAGALHVDLAHVRLGRGPIAVLATLGVLASTGLVAAGFFLVAKLAGAPVPLAWCLVFGALISPTDPVAVMGLLSDQPAPPTLKATVAGESLFNDGVGIVLFTILVAFASGGADIGWSAGLRMFLVEAGGGVLLGLTLGYLAYLLMRSIDEYVTEVMISLAVVMGGYSIALALHVSGPVAMAVAGLIVGNYGVSHAMSDKTRTHLLSFWDLLDQILNAALFLLIGLEGIALLGEGRLVIVGLALIPISLAARAASVAGPVALWRRLLPPRSSMLLLTWGGLRGGISIALALTLPAGPSRPVILATTYVVVMFSVLVQGATVTRLIARLFGSAKTPPSSAAQASV